MSTAISGNMGDHGGCERFVPEDTSDCRRLHGFHHGYHQPSHGRQGHCIFRVVSGSHVVGVGFRFGFGVRVGVGVGECEGVGVLGC